MIAQWIDHGKFGDIGSAVFYVRSSTAGVTGKGESQKWSEFYALYDHLDDDQYMLIEIEGLPGATNASANFEMRGYKAAGAEDGTGTYLYATDVAETDETTMTVYVNGPIEKNDNGKKGEIKFSFKDLVGRIRSSEGNPAPDVWAGDITVTISIMKGTFVPPVVEPSEEPASEEPASEEPASEEPASEEPTSEEASTEPLPEGVVYDADTAIFSGATTDTKYVLNYDALKAALAADYAANGGAVYTFEITVSTTAGIGMEDPHLMKDEPALDFATSPYFYEWVDAGTPVTLTQTYDLSAVTAADLNGLYIVYYIEQYGEYEITISHIKVTRGDGTAEPSEEPTSETPVSEEPASEEPASEAPASEEPASEPSDEASETSLFEDSDDPSAEAGVSDVTSQVASDPWQTPPMPL